MDDMQALTREIIKKLASALQTLSVYEFNHPSAKKAIDQLYEQMKSALEEAEYIDFGVAAGEVFSKKHIFFDLIAQTQDFVQLLQDRKIDYIKFKAGLRKKELIGFLRLIRDKRTKGYDTGSLLKKEGLVHISTKKFGGEADLEKDDKDSRKFSQVNNLYDEYLSKIRKNVDDFSEGTSGNLESLMEVSSNMLNLLMRHEQFFFLAMNIKHHDDYTFAHCLNVSAIAMSQAERMGMPKEWVVKTGLAAFLHDTGKFAVHKKIINKKGKLTDEEFRQMRNHAELGAKMLLKQERDLELPVIVAFQHHVGFNQQGYPKVSLSKKQHLISELVSISDVYDALRTRRSYRKPMSLERVYDIMQKEKGRLFSPDLVDLFFENMGVWPVGTLVELNTGDVGLVIKNNPREIFRPQVQVVYDASGEKVGGKITLDLAETDPRGEFIREITRQIEGTKEQEDYIAGLVEAG